MGYRVLIIDDSPLTCALLQNMLIKLGHTVAGQAGTAADGLKAFFDVKPDVVLLDVSLPDEHGLTVLRDIREKDPKAKVVMVTANSQDKILDQARKLNVSGFLAKPFEMKELSAVVDQAFSQK